MYFIPSLLNTLWVSLRASAWQSRNSHLSFEIAASLSLLAMTGRRTIRSFCRGDSRIARLSFGRMFCSKTTFMLVSSFHRKRSPSLSDGGYKYDVPFVQPRREGLDSVVIKKRPRYISESIFLRKLLIYVFTNVFNY